jgi:multiple antibiotic resistance protein
MFWKEFLMAFIPLFVAFDVIGILPVFVGITGEMDDKTRRKVTFLSILTATLIGSAFVIAGKLIFTFLGITITDFQIAGGVVLFILAIGEMFGETKVQRKPAESDTVGIVPIGMPLILGPAALATLMMSMDEYGILIASCALIANLLIMWIVLWQATNVIRRLGETVSGAISKIMGILLAAIAIMMIRKGFVSILKNIN